MSSRAPPPRSTRSTSSSPPEPDLDEPEQRALALGATAAVPQPDKRWRVLLDPAGHPFCITSLAPPPEMLRDVYGR
ncbi:MAG TPA: VOC family protein [Pseudonocardia sp.]|uniref:VOC family protein n=1 Tax=Pseudonocardia sp. TaxID=60912 RepID=UPI002CDAE0FF|nr:VOC family protein [Pseudonocardia sp.]HTF48375.1 VOC family protein [Pseudonocardia sp.]